jgi:membrane protein
LDESGEDFAQKEVVLTARIGRAVEKVRRVAKNCQADRCQMIAGALTLQTLFALVPGLTIAYLSLSTFEASLALSRSMENVIFSYVVPESVAKAQEYLRQFSDQAQTLSIPSAVLLGITAILMLNTIEQTFNQIWRVTAPRTGLRRLAVYIALLTLGPLLLVLGLSITIYVFSLPYLSNLAGSQWGLWILPFLTSAAMYTLAYWVIPNALVNWRHALLGGLGVAVIFEVARFGFALVMTYSDMAVVYGAFAVLPGLLLWIYISWLIILAGAELVAEIGGRE